MSNSGLSVLFRANVLMFVIILALLTLLTAGTVVYHTLEGWSWVSSFYFTVCTLTTIGYGDLTPTSDTSRLFTALFALAGVTIAFTSLSILGTMYIRRGEVMLSRIGESKRA